jgi:hypothetical protein
MDNRLQARPKLRVTGSNLVATNTAVVDIIYNNSLLGSATPREIIL